MKKHKRHFITKGNKPHRPYCELVIRLCDFEEIMKGRPASERKKWQLMHVPQFKKHHEI